MRRFNILFAFAFILLTSCFTDEVDYVGYQPSTKGGIHIVGAVEEYDIKSVGTRADDDGIADSYISEMTMFIFKSNGDLIQGYTDVDFSSDNKCTSAINIQRGNPTFLIDTEEGILADLSGGSDTDIVYYNNNAADLGACDIYIVANVWHQLTAPTPEQDDDEDTRVVDTIKTLADLEAFVYQADDTLAMPTVEKDGATQVCGFPMIGKQQGASFKLSKGADNEGNAVATIPLKKLYSKVRFTMQINADQVVAGQTPKFTIRQVEVFNVPKMARLGRDYDKDGNLIYGDYLEEIANTESTSTPSDYYYCTNTADPTAKPEDAPFVINKFNKKTISHSTSSTTDDVIEFGFYMPEHMVTPNPIQLPSTMTAEEKEKYAQYYKPTGVGAVRNGDGTTSAAKIATFVRIHGSYTDHNSQILDVTYDIYLGQNNFDDFTIKRNQLLNNKLIITGLTNHKDAYNNEDTNNDGKIDENDSNISIDHRVEVADRGFNLSMERTAILDAHFEVRPLDIELQPGATMTITIPEAHRSWVAMEDDYEARRTKDNTLYVNTTLARKGVRKYFTTDLVKELNNLEKYTDGNGGTITLVNNEATTEIFRIWFYVDENPNVYDKTYKLETPNTTNGYTVSKEQYRVCPVQFVYNGTKVVKDKDTGKDVTVDVTKTETINFQQWNLWRVWSGNRYYDIEHEEEYLNNYASDLQYGSTQDGMEFGLVGVQLSHLYQAFYLESDSDNWLDQWGGNSGDAKTAIIQLAIEKLGFTPKYDYYLPRDTNNEQLKIREYSGRTFNTEMIEYLRSEYPFHQSELNDDSYIAKVDKISLIQQPKSALAYCFNKNKRNESGVIENINWYLPSIDEIEDIAEGAYDEFERVFQNQKYWSCQPSYVPYYIHFDRYRWYLFSGWSVDNNEDIAGNYYIDDIYRARSTSIVMNSELKPQNIDSGAEIYKQIINGKFYLSNSGSLAGSKNKTIELGTESVVNEIYYDTTKHPGNLSRTESCRIRAVYRSGTNSGTK